MSAASAGSRLAVPSLNPSRLRVEVRPGPRVLGWLKPGTIQRTTIESRVARISRRSAWMQVSFVPPQIWTTQVAVAARRPPAGRWGRPASRPDGSGDGRPGRSARRTCEAPNPTVIVRASACGVGPRMRLSGGGRRGPSGRVDLALRQPAGDRRQVLQGGGQRGAVGGHDVEHGHHAGGRHRGDDAGLVGTVEREAGAGRRGERAARRRGLPLRLRPGTRRPPCQRRPRHRSALRPGAAARVGTGPQSRRLTAITSPRGRRRRPPGTGPPTARPGPPSAGCGPHRRAGRRRRRRHPARTAGAARRWP